MVSPRWDEGPVWVRDANRRFREGVLEVQNSRLNRLRHLLFGTLWFRHPTHDCIMVNIKTGRALWPDSPAHLWK